MSTMDEQITADENPVEDLDPTSPTDTPVEADPVEDSLEGEAAVTPEETAVSDETEVEGEPPAPEADIDLSAGDDSEDEVDGPAEEVDTTETPATRASADDAVVDPEADWTTVAYGMAEGMSVDMLEAGEYSSDEYDEMMALLEKHKPDRLVLLGDVKHGVPATSFSEKREIPLFFEALFQFLNFGDYLSIV